MLSDFFNAKTLFIIEDIFFFNYKKHEEDFKTKSVRKYDF